MKKSVMVSFRSKIYWWSFLFIQLIGWGLGTIIIVRVWLLFSIKRILSYPAIALYRFMLLFIFVIVRDYFFWVEVNLCTLSLSFVYICIVVGDPIIKRWRVRIPLVGLNPPYYSDGHKPGLELPTSFFYNGLRWNVVIRFEDVGAIVCHHCSFFLFINLLLILSGWEQITFWGPS